MAQRKKKLSVTDPPLLLDQFVMHDGDVSCGAAEADPSQLEPEPQRFPEWGHSTAPRGLSCNIPGPETWVIPSTHKFPTFVT
jgi:hypothetical protein